MILKKNKGATVVSFSKRLLDNVMDNQDDPKYIEAFENYSKNVIFHELSHLYLKTNEIEAAKFQNNSIDYKPFTDDLNTKDGRMPKKEIESMVNAVIFSDDVMKYSNLDINEKYTDKYEDVINKLSKGIKEYALNDVSNENIDLYVHGDRNSNKNLYVHNLEYASNILKEEMIKVPESDNDKLDEVTRKYLSSSASKHLLGGIHANMLVYSELKNFDPIEKELLKNIIAKDMLDNHNKLNNYIGMNYTLTEDEKQIVFDNIKSQVDKLDDLTKEKVIAFKDKTKDDVSLNIFEEEQEKNDVFYGIIR